MLYKNYKLFIMNSFLKLIIILTFLFHFYQFYNIFHKNHDLFAADQFKFIQIEYWTKIKINQKNHND